MLLAAAASFVIPDKYISRAVIRVRATNHTVLPSSSNKDLTISKLASVPGEWDIVAITFTHSDRFKAQQTIMDLIYTEHPSTGPFHLPTPSTIRKPPIQIIDAPGLPQLPISPNRAVLSGMGLFTGLLFWISTRRSGAGSRPATS
jgi:hypothetical protein